MNRTDLKKYIQVFLLGAVLSLAWGTVTGLLHLEKVFPNQGQEAMFAVRLPAQIALYGVGSPILEEVLFRGLLFGLIRRILPDRISAVITSALFALWHGNVLQMLYAFPAGLILQKLRSRSGRMEAPILCHIGANLTAILISSFMRQAFPA
jgi:membrane protease YdiL (CAAX protease family)